ncbi:TLC domain-containing protein 1 isoform X1 [Equus asinus]
MPPLLHPALPLLLGATLTFRALRRALCRLPLPKHVRADPLRTWRWHNLLVSFAHSIVSGTWALLCVWQAPEMLVEIETAWSLSGYLLVCFSAGYFIHDTVDIVVSRQARASWEYLVHHVMAMAAFFSGIFWRSFVGGGVLTLLVEVSNIFLTIRMMMKINNAQDLLLYRINKEAAWSSASPPLNLHDNLGGKDTRLWTSLSLVGTPFRPWHPLCAPLSASRGRRASRGRLYESRPGPEVEEGSTASPRALSLPLFPPAGSWRSQILRSSHRCPITGSPG